VGVGGQLKGDRADVVAIVVAVGNGLVANDAAAGAVVNGQGDAKILAHCLAESAQNSVGTAAGSPRAHDVDALGRILSRGRDGRHAQNEHQRNRQREKLLHRDILLKKI